MGSVIDYIECPNCHHEAYNDYYYKSGEEFTICYNCGYYHSYYRSEEDNEFKETLIANPYGYYHAKSSTGGVGGSLEKKEDLTELLEVVSTVKENEHIKIIKLSQYINNEIIVKEVYNRTKYLRLKKLQQIQHETTL